MKGSTPPRSLLVALIVLHVVVAALTWHDIRHRAEADIRGSKRMWRIASAMQMGNSLAYWVFGRKQTA